MARLLSVRRRLPFDRLVRAVRSHPDVALLVVLLAVALVVRALFVFRAPLFIRRDSITYFEAGYELARGAGFDLPLRRTPLYPLFIAGVVWTLGEDLRSLALVQHLLGLVTVVATYFLGKALFGRGAGFAAALLTAVSAPLLIYEHYILSEPLFTPLLVMGLLLIVRALQSGGSWPLVAGGAVLALAALVRPIGQAVLPVVPLVVLLQSGSPRSAIKPVALVLAGFAVVLVPWTVRGALASGRGGSTGALGQSLIDRISRHDEGLVIPSPDSPTTLTDPTRIAVRRLILTQAARDARPSAINHRIREQFGLTEAEANTAMRDVAVEVILSQPGRYFWGTLAKSRRILVGDDERLRSHWGSRKDGELREDWLAERSIAHVYSPPSAVEEAESPTAEAITRIFQPAQWRAVLAILIALGIGLGLVRGPRSPAVLLVLTIAALVVPSAAIVGQVLRYRYPADPLLAVFVGGGIVAVGLLARSAVRRFSRPRVTAMRPSPRGAELS